MPRSKAASVPAPEATTRDHIVEVADALFYQRGFDRTSFADIAAQVQISRGNFYYHFKSKDDILAAVIERRAAGTQAMLEAWAGESDEPLERLRCFARMLIVNRKDIQRYGCPVGSLCTELAKLEHPAQGQAGMIFGQFRDWLREQFEALGHADDAHALALHLLSRSQGVATLANAFRDEAFIRHEVALIDAWLASLVPPARARRRAS
ncbi:TetR/AcrR family transcriptional regulator [Roseateles asaccharophilus]|uniref:AcrR family transcriptional regulator n=1 Tax=Roseateles asaccharophilus TaxID=582607 RepID=A0ABU2A5G7_9BURK|nr:TetR/AcrR family transcriptional regulator [Roseateles asaccharophilus]MDR7331843.1 AcrR family transcriptional regulator [Roseateles asaccharophilus]